jgi:hypothetical protein
MFPYQREHDMSPYQTKQIRDYANGWNDAMLGKPIRQFTPSRAYAAGYYDSKRVAK